jgi:broad specificity phosphatase PhoE
MNIFCLRAACTLLLTVFLAVPASLASQSPAATSTTTVIVVRHAEKATDDPRDPSLNSVGQLRAQLLADALEDAGVTALYVTQYKRTRATAEPLASRLKLVPVERSVASGSADGHARDLAREILSRHRGGTVVVVGHSNTVPAIVEAMSGRKVMPITEAEYDHIFIVIVPQAGSARLVKARYGEASVLVPSG